LFRRFIGRHAYLRFSRDLWNTMFLQLGRRAGGHRESGAFLLADRGGDGRTVTSIAYYDDLDPTSLRGDIRLDAAAYGRLWDLCDARRAWVVGDVHTHGGTYVEQSCTDRNNPMVARAGHIALLVPYLGGKLVGPREVGVHRYDGADGWVRCYGKEAARRLYVGRFP
jgi:hypothetical protein